MRRAVPILFLCEFVTVLPSVSWVLAVFAFDVIIGRMVGVGIALCTELVHRLRSALITVLDVPVGVEQAGLSEVEVTPGILRASKLAESRAEVLDR